MSDNEKQQTGNLQQDSSGKESEKKDELLWQYLERAERRANEPPLFELAESLSASQDLGFIN